MWHFHWVALEPIDQAMGVDGVGDSAKIVDA